MIEPDKTDPPSFQSIADLASTTGISLNVFLHSNHRNMPNFILSDAQSNDLIAYILSLKKKQESRVRPGTGLCLPFIAGSEQ